MKGIMGFLVTDKIEIQKVDQIPLHDTTICGCWNHEVSCKICDATFIAKGRFTCSALLTAAQEEAYRCFEAHVKAVLK